MIRIVMVLIRIAMIIVIRCTRPALYTFTFIFLWMPTHICGSNNVLWNFPLVLPTSRDWVSGEEVIY